MLRGFHIGVDLGQRADHTAIVVVEQRVECTGVRDARTFEFEWRRRMIVTKVARLRLGTAFQSIVREVERLTWMPEFEGCVVTTAVDATGIGLVVTELLQQRKLRGELYPVVITGGQEMRYSAGFYPTPRTDILLGVCQAFEVDGLEVARGVAGWEGMVEELKSIRKYQSVAGPRFESEGRHDDLVFGLGLALIGARRRVLPVEGERVRRRSAY